MSVSEAQRLKELEKENGRLKRLLAERILRRNPDTRQARRRGRHVRRATA